MHLFFDENEFKALMNDFYLVTNTKIVFYDVDLNPIISVPEEDCAFCTALKKNPQMLTRCKQCIEREVKKCKEENKLNIYKCHSGLTEVVAPIIINDSVLGYIMFGQILDKTEKKQKSDEIISYASKYSNENISAFLSKVTTKNLKQIHAVSRFMEICISYLVINNLIKTDQTSLAVKITKYINENLSSDLSVATLCSTFGISRNALYKIFNDYYSISVAKYIREKRIELAQKLISSGASVTLAASSVGFDDYNYFSKVFKAIVGIPPLKYKQKCEE